MEVSSHALELHRADAIAFDCVVFTNLTQDHLDFHGTLDHYFGAKRSLFLPARRPPPDRVGRQSRRRVGAQAGRASWARPGRRGSSPSPSATTPTTARSASARAGRDRASTCVTAEGSEHVDLPQPGLFNVYNAIAAIAACGCVGRRHRRGGRRAAAIRRRCRAGSRRSSRASPSACWSTTPTRPTRSRTCCAVRASCWSGPDDAARAADLRVRRRWRPRRRQAPADGRDRALAVRPGR